MNAADQGRIVWADYMSSDVAKSTKFYQSLLGWTITPMKGDGFDYPMWTNNGAPLGGSMPLPDEAKKHGAPSHWLMYVAVQGIDKAHAKAKQLGGVEHVPPTDIPEVGRFSVLADPQGAFFCLYESSQDDTTPDELPPVGNFSWYELATTDLEAAKKFYGQLFGWEMRDAHDMGPLGPYQIFGRKGGRDVGGMYKKPPEMKDMPPNWCLYARVADLDKAAEQVKKLGGMVVNGPMEVPGGDRVLNGVDTTGGYFALHQTAN